MSERLTSLREQLAVHAPELRPIAEHVLAAVHRIDLVAIDASGVAHTILLAADGEDPAALTHAVAASAWLSARLADWRQLAPDAGIDAARPARAVVVARRFHPDTLALADLLGDEHIRLVVLDRNLRAPPAPARASSEAPATKTRTTPPPTEGPARSEEDAAERGRGALESRFRTGLAPADLGFATP